MDAASPFSADTDGVTGASGSSLLSVFVSAVDWAGDAAFCVCARPTILARHRKQIRTVRTLNMPFPLPTALVVRRVAVDWMYEGSEWILI
jgi:hypothetical protein